MHLRRLAASISLLAAGCSTDGAQVDPAPLSVEGLTELRWIAADANALDVLTRQPANCYLEDERNDPVDIAPGEVLFNSPLLLGGQAAKAGISCASCHRNGRGNPSFVFQGVSGAPGTADVSHGLFGKLRDDDEFNPVPIPDLAMPEGKVKVSRDDPDALARFLRAQIVEEFDGPEPSDQVIADLANYLMRLKADCADVPDEPISWNIEVTRIHTAFLQSLIYKTSDPETSRAYIDAGRAALGRLHARFSAPEHEKIRLELVAWSKGLQEGMRYEDHFDMAASVDDLIEAHAETSLYNRDVLRRALKAN